MIVPATRFELDVGGVKLSVCGDFSEYRQVGGRRHDDDGLDVRGDGVFGQGIARIPLSRYRQAGQAEHSGHRYGHGHAAVLERQSRVGAETRVMLPFVLDFEATSHAIGQMMCVGNAWRAPLAARDDVLAIVRIINIQRQEPAEAPEIAPRRGPPAVRSPFGLEPVANPSQSGAAGHHAGTG